MKLLSKILAATVMTSALAGCGSSSSCDDCVQTHVDNTPVPGEPGPSATSATPSSADSSADAPTSASTQAQGNLAGLPG